MGERKRIDSFDILKSIAIFLVVFCHYTTLSNTVAENFAMTICFVGVPLFFMVNGALLLHKPFNLKKHLLKTGSVYVVATVWRVLYLLIDAFKAGTLEQILDAKTQTLSYALLWTNSTFTAPAHMWFIKSLLAIYLIFPLLHICFQKGKEGKSTLYFLLILLFVGVNVVTEADFAISMLKQYAAFNTTLSASPLSAFLPYTSGGMLFYFVLGAVLWEYLSGTDERQTHTITRKHRVIAAACFLVSWVIMMWTKSLDDGTWGWNGVLYSNGYARIPTFLATVSLFVLCSQLEIRSVFVRRICTTVSSCTLGIYYLHWSIAPFVTRCFTSVGLWQNTAKTVVVLTASCLISWALGHIPIVRKLVK